MIPNTQRWALLTAGFLLGWFSFGGCEALAQDGGTCVTACGMTSREMVCRELQEVETRTLLAYSRHVGWNYGRMCRALKGWDVRWHAGYTVADVRQCPIGAWLLADLDGWCIIGYAHRGARTLEIGLGDLLTSSLAHEIGHVLDFALTPHIGHCRWRERGFYKAQREVTGSRETGRSAITNTGDCSADGGF